MKKMKTKLFSIVFILMISTSIVSAQDIGKAKVSFAILGGVNFQNLNGKDMFGDKLVNKMIIGYHAGFNIQLPVAPQFFFQPGLLLSTKGAENKALISTYKLSYIEMPLNFVYKGSLGNGNIMIGFGPYIAYGIAGKATIESGSVTLKTDIKYKNVVEIGDPILTTYFRAFDAGGNIFVGYEMAGGIFLQLNSQFGMIEINPEYKLFTTDKSSVKNTGFGLSLGYKF